MLFSFSYLKWSLTIPTKKKKAREGAMFLSGRGPCAVSQAELVTGYTKGEAGQGCLLSAMVRQPQKQAVSYRAVRYIGKRLQPFGNISTWRKCENSYQVQQNIKLRFMYFSYRL